MSARLLALAAILAAFLASPAAAAPESASPAPVQAEQEECGGTVAVLCEHPPSTPHGTICILYVSPICVLWI